MFRWYQQAVKCYVYLPDVTASVTASENPSQRPWETDFRRSRWFTRGWTLQELLAPEVVEFFSREKQLLGDKIGLAQLVHEITKIPVAALQGTPLPQFGITERIRWTRSRTTKKNEDQAYCLLGIFGVHMPLIYGEGDFALTRLQREINYQFGSNVAAELVSADPHEFKSVGLYWGSAPLIGVDDFIGRTAELDQMVHYLKPGEPAVEQRRLVLGGMGGIGKTQLAIAYARRYHTCYASVLWLNATSEQTLKASFRSVATLLLTEHELDQLNDEGTVRAVLRWLSVTRNEQWLLILDNYDDIQAYNVQDYLPQTARGSVLVTTRLPELLIGQRMPQLRVPPINDLKDCLKLLQSRSQREEVENDPSAHRLATRLEGLPLALATAGAYLRKASMTFDQYLAIYEDRFNINPRRPTQLQEYQDRTLYTTWNLSYQHLEAEDMLAARTLKSLAYFDNEKIWYGLFRAGLSDNTPAWLQEVISEHADFDNVMGTLVDYCFLEAHPATGSYSMHKCVHDWASFHLNEIVDLELYSYASDCVVEHLGVRARSELVFPTYAPLVRHALRLGNSRLTDAMLRQESPIEWYYRMNRLADLLLAQTQISVAERLYVLALTEYRKSPNHHHDHLCTTVLDLGVTYRMQDQSEKAAQILAPVLSVSEKVMGSEHTTTLDLMLGLAGAYVDQNKLEEAEKILLQALATLEKASGLHPAWICVTYGNLGGLHEAQGRLKEAERMYQRALSESDKTMGPEHILTLQFTTRLGSLIIPQGRIEEAKEMLLWALTAGEKVLGVDQINTLSTAANLALVYEREGKLNLAEQLYTRVLAGLVRQLGEEYPFTIQVADRLVRVRERRVTNEEVEEPGCTQHTSSQ